MRGAVVLGVLAALAGVGLAASSGLLISRAALRPEVFLSLILLVTTVRALGLGRAALRYAERLAGHAVALAQGARARLALFDQLSRFGRDLLSHERAGDLLARGGTDLDARQFYTLRVTLPLWAFGGVALLLLTLLALFDPLLAALGVGPLLLGAGAVLGARTRAGALAREAARLGREHTTRLLDALAAGTDGARHHRPHLAGLAERLRLVTEEQGRLAARLTLGRELAFAVAVAGMLGRGGALLEAGALPGPWLAGLVLATAAAFDALAPLAAVPAAHAAREEVREREAALRALAPAVRPPAQPLPLPPQPLPLELHRVSVTRAGRAVLRDVTLTLRPGERVALRGPSGGGKTTLTRLLTRDLDPDAGQVTLGGADLRNLDPDALRARFSLHEQDAPLLDGTVEENLRLGGHHAPPERLRALLDDLGLSHLALDTWVGEGGSRLSGGERARVSLARALLRPADVLILDEPTAHLDPETEQKVLATIERERAGRTLLVVTHRSAPLAWADRVLTLQAGHLCEDSLHRRSA